MSALLSEKSGAIVTLTINRPESRNPLGEEGDGPLFAEACAAINAASHLAHWPARSSSSPGWISPIPTH